MTWFRVDDGFSDHAKVHALQEHKHWKGALALWTLAGAWCAKHEKDGHVTHATVKRLGFVSAEADALVECGLWRAAEGGYLFHQWQERNPLRSELESKREQTRSKVTAWRDKNKKPGCNPVTREHVTGYKEVGNHPVTLPPSRPVPDPSQTLPERESERAPDGRFPEVKSAVRRTFAAGFEHHEGSLWTRANDPALDTFVAWALSLPDPELAARTALANFFADPWVKSKHFPIEHLAKYPQKYHSPRELDAEAPETAESLRAIGRAAVHRGDDAQVAQIAKRIKALEERTAESQVRRAR